MDNWTCSECGYNKGAMAMQGNGLLRCPGCNSLLMVTGWGFIKVIRKGVKAHGK